MPRVSAISPNRICRHFGNCGGCSLQDLTPDDYRAAKRAAVQHALMQAGVNAEVLAPVIVPPQSRRRAVFKIKSLPEGLHIGFHAAKSHTVIDMHQCEVLTPGLFKLVGDLRARLEKLMGVGEAAELHVTQTDTGFDAGFRWKRNLTPVLTAELSRALAGLGIARLTLNEETVFETAAPRVDARVQKPNHPRPYLIVEHPSEHGETVHAPVRHPSSRGIERDEDLWERAQSAAQVLCVRIASERFGRAVSRE